MLNGDSNENGRKKSIGLITVAKNKNNFAREAPFFNCTLGATLATLATFALLATLPTFAKFASYTCYRRLLHLLLLLRFFRLLHVFSVKMYI